MADCLEGGTFTHTARPQRLERLASEFESMLMLQVLEDVRRAGRWEDGAEDDSAGAQSVFRC